MFIKIEETHEELLHIAIEKYKKQNIITDKDYKLPIDSFILKLYNNCDSTARGKHFMKKVLKDNYTKFDDEFGFYSINDAADIGDAVITYPKMTLRWEIFWIDPRHPYAGFLDYQTQVSKSYIETKMSYLNKSNGYSIKHIRPYQEFNYYLLCFVDCDDNFKANYFMVNKEVITANYEIAISIMNGTKKINEKNGNKIYSATIKKNSRAYNSLLNNNLLSGTDYFHLSEFIVKEGKVLKEHFNTNIPLKVA
jgi:hypothetical protein